MDPNRPFDPSQVIRWYQLFHRPKSSFLHHTQRSTTNCLKWSLSTTVGRLFLRTRCDYWTARHDSFRAWRHPTSRSRNCTLAKSTHGNFSKSWINADQQRCCSYQPDFITLYYKGLLLARRPICDSMQSCRQRQYEFTADDFVLPNNMNCKRDARNRILRFQSTLT